MVYTNVRDYRNYNKTDLINLLHNVIGRHLMVLSVLMINGILLKKKCLLYYQLGAHIREY